MTSPQYMHQLHGFRALAALGVLIFHWGALFGIHPQLHAQGGAYSLWWWLSFFTGSGWLGVMVFFVLSGTVLSTPYLEGKSPRLRGFYGRRALRIYPAVWLQLFVLAIASVWIVGLPPLKWNSDLIANALLWIHLPPGFVKPVNGVWWTLPIELGFYLFFPLVLYFYRRLGAFMLMAVAGGCCIVWRLGVFYYFDTASYAPYQIYLDALPSSIFYFCVGIVVAHMASPRIVHAYVFIAIGLAVILGLLFYLVSILDRYWAGHTLLLLWPLLCAPAIGLLIYALRQPRLGFQWLASRLFRWMGDISFGIYLWHFPILLVLHHYCYSPEFSLMENVGLLLVSLVATLVLAATSFHCLEAPVMRWGRKRLAAIRAGQ